MAFEIADRVKERVFVIGTGNVQVGSAAPTGFQNFPTVMTVDGPPTWYCIADSFSGAWEVGEASLLAGDKLGRTPEGVLASSNADALVNFPGNVCDVFQTVPASQVVGVATFAQTSFIAAGATTAADLYSRFGDMPNAARDFALPLDGTSDCGTIISAAASALALRGTNYLIVPNPGVQLTLATPIVLPSGFNLRFTGNPMLRLTAANARAMSLIGKSGIQVDGRVTVDGTGITFVNTNSVLLISGCSDVEMFDWRIQSTPKEWQIINSSSYVALRRFKSFNGGNAGGTIQNSHDWLIEDFEATGQASFGVFVDGTAAGLNYNGRIVRPKSLQSGRELVGIRWACDRIDVFDPHSENSGDNAISMTGTNCRVLGGYLGNSARDALAIFGANNSAIGIRIRNAGTNLAAHYVGVRVESNYGGVAENAIVEGCEITDDTGSVTMYASMYLGIGYITWAPGVSVASLSPSDSSSGFCRNVGNIYSTTAPPTTLTGAGPAPTHTSGTVSDGNVLWTFVNTIDPGFTNVQASAWVSNMRWQTGRSGGNPLVDVTTSGASRLFTDMRVKTNNFLLDSSGMTISGLLPIKKSSTAWVTATDYIYADTRVSTNNRSYRVTNVGGHSSVAPSHTTIGQIVTGADGIAWLALDAGPSYNQALANTNRMQFGSYGVEATSDPSIIMPRWVDFGAPNGKVTASPGAQYTQIDGAPGAISWFKESGVMTTTGWVAK